MSDTEPIKEEPLEESEEQPTEQEETLSDVVKEFLEETEPLETPEVETEPKEVQEEEIEVPLEEITQEVIKKTKDEVKEDILKALGISSEEKSVIEEQGYKFPWEKRGDEAPSTYKELVEATIEFQDFKKSEQEKLLSEQQKHDLVVAKEREETINAEWDVQLDYLREEGFIPQIDPKIQEKLDTGKVLTNQERQDAGLKAQADIFEAMYKVSQERELLGQPPIVDVIHVYNRYYKKPEKPSGSKAPVSGANASTQEEEDNLTYEQLHNARGFEELIK